MNEEWIEEVDVDRVQEVKERFLELHGVLSIHDFITGWFHGAPYEQIHRGNVLDFVAYGFYSKRPQDLSPKVCMDRERPSANVCEVISAHFFARFMCMHKSGLHIDAATMHSMLTGLKLCASKYVSLPTQAPTN